MKGNISGSIECPLNSSICVVYVWYMCVRGIEFISVSTTFFSGPGWINGLGSWIT